MKRVELKNEKSTDAMKTVVSTIQKQRRQSIDLITRQQTEFLRKQSRVLPPILEAKRAATCPNMANSNPPQAKLSTNPSVPLPDINAYETVPQSEAVEESKPSQANVLWSFVFDALHDQNSSYQSALKGPIPLPILPTRRPDFTGRRLARYRWDLIRKNLRYLTYVHKRGIEDEKRKVRRKLSYLRNIGNKMKEMDRVYDSDLDGRRKRSMNLALVNRKISQSNLPSKQSQLTNLARYYWGRIRKNLTFLIFKARIEEKERREDLFHNIHKCRYIRYSISQISDIESRLDHDSEAGVEHSKYCFCPSCTTKQLRDFSIHKVEERNKLNPLASRKSERLTRNRSRTY